MLLPTIGSSIWRLRIGTLAGETGELNTLTGGKPATTNANNQHLEGMSHKIELKRNPAMAASWAGVSVGASTRFGGARAWGRLWLGCALAGGLGTVSAAEWASSKNRFNLNTHIGFNIEANFEQLGGVSGSDAGSELRGTDRFYDDGYNRVDATGNAGGETQFWGYDQASQVVGDSLVMSSYSATGTGRDPRGDGRAALGRGIETTRVSWDGTGPTGGGWRLV